MSATDAGSRTGAARGWFARLAEAFGAAKGVWAAVVTILLAAGAALAAGLIGATTPGRAAESFFYDLRVGLMAPPAVDGVAIVKIDDAALLEMQNASPCRCLSPIDKVWLGALIADLDAKGAAVIGIDYLFDSWRSPEEYAGFVDRVRGVKAPLVAVVDPNRRAVFDYPIVPGMIYSDARALVKSDYDDVVRRYDPFPGPQPSFGAALATALGVAPPTAPFAMRYRAPTPGAAGENAGAVAPSISAALARDLPPEFFAGKAVLIGRVTRSASADADTVPEDLHTTPLRFLPGHYDGTPGVEVHAHALAQMATGERLTTLSLLGQGAVLLLAALAGAFLGRTTSSWWVAALAAVFGVAGGIGAAFAAYGAAGLMVPIAPALLAFALSFFLLSRLMATQLSGERAFYASTLERYLAPQVIDRIVEGAEEVKIGADRRDMTVLVTDIENFSTLVAETPLEEFSEIINGYFDGLIEVLWRNEAMVDKLTGDGLIALFGAPVPSRDHAQRAVACARALDAFAEGYRAQVLARYGRAFGRTRMGLHSGEGLVGNFGGAKRFNYTAYGQVVVIAARLEAANKETQTRVLMSRATFEACGAPADARPLGALALKGVAAPEEVYTLPDPVTA